MALQRFIRTNLRTRLDRSAHLARLALMGMIASAVGCQSPTEAPNPLTIDAQEYDRVYAATIDVLQNAGFTVDQRDYRFGLVGTAPRHSPTMLEPWHSDNTTSDQSSRSTLGHLRRTVQVHLEPLPETSTEHDAPPATAPQNQPVTAEATRNRAAQDSSATQPATNTRTDAYALRVEVQMQRRQVPVRRMTGSVQTGVFSELAAVPAEWRRRGIDAAYWQPVGRDPYLEQRLVRRIIHRSMRLPE